MRPALRLLTALLVLSTFACSGDDGGTETNASESAATTGDTTFACGELECAANEACLTFPQSPACQDMVEGQPCPEGTTETQCGGAGIPCCCEPAPPPIYQCSNGNCGDALDCMCLSEICVPSCSATADPQGFICEEPPAP